MLRVTSYAETIVTGVERLPAVKLQRDGQGSVAVRVGDRGVARIDVRHGRVFVAAPADTIFELADSREGGEALAAIRRRVKVELLIWQFRVASP